MRILVVSGLVFLLLALGWGTSGMGQELPVPRGELRVVDKDLSNFGSIVFNVFEHLLELDKDGKMVPGLATSWRWLDAHTLEVHLRQGVRFHSGEVMDAEIVKLNVEETIQLRHAFYAGEFLNFKPGLRIEILDPYTLRFHFAEPDGAALARLSYVHIANRQFLRDFGWGGKQW
jgi:peptide/nickel transport system substrate-binding protein